MRTAQPAVRARRGRHGAPVFAVLFFATGILAGAFPAAAAGATSSTSYEVSRVDAPDPQLRGRWGERTATVADRN